MNENNISTLKISFTFENDRKLRECYIYAGQSFFTFSDGALACLHLEPFLKKKLTDAEFSFCRFAFFRNDWLSNEQSQTVFGITQMKNSFLTAWRYFGKTNRVFFVNDDDLIFSPVSLQTPVFDIKVYGMNIFIGGRNGLFAAPISIVENSKAFFEKMVLPKSLPRILDAPVTQINAKCGALLLSSNREGLFFGSFTNTELKIAIREKPIREKSLYTAWSQYDVLNYEEKNHFQYMVSERIKDEKRSFYYSRGDEESGKQRITSIGDVFFEMEDVFVKKEELVKDLAFVYNGGESCFLCYPNGRLKVCYFNKDNLHKPENKRIKLKKQIVEDLPKLPEAPISAATVGGNRYVFELMNSLMLLQNHKKTVLEDSPFYSFKTYPTSIRYKNVISVVIEEGLNLYAVFPEV